MGRDHTLPNCFWWRTLPATREEERQCSGNGIHVTIATKIIRKLHAWSDPHFPPISLAHASTHNFLPTTATSKTSYFITSLNCFNLCLKGEIQEDGTREKIFLATDHSYCSSENPNCCLHCHSQNVSPRARGHMLASCTGMTALPIPSAWFLSPWIG